MTPLRRLLAVVTTTAVAATLAVVAPVSAQAAEEIYPAPASGSWTVDGRAWGHGRGMSQWGAQRAAQQGRSAAEILAFYYPGTRQESVGNRMVTVALTRFTPTTSVTIWSHPDRRLRMGPIAGETVLPPGRWTVTVSGGTVRAQRRDLDKPTGPVTETRTYPARLGFPSLRFESLSAAGSGDQGGVIIAGSSGATSGRWYRGDFRIVPTGDAGGTGFNVTNTLPMEDYLRSVVPRESPASWEYAALEAQSVAARSYAERRVRLGSAMCDTTSCQVYYGRGDASTAGTITFSGEDSRTDTAIARTAGRVLFHGDDVAFTEYSSNNGGWTTASNVSYQVAKEDRWTTSPDPRTGVLPPRTTWSDTLPVARVQQQCPAGGTLRNLVLTRTGNGPLGGRVTQARVECSNGNRVINTPSFGLFSSWWRPRASVPRLESPAVSASAIDPGQVVVVGVTPNVGMDWTLTVRDRSTNRVARTVRGTATAGVRFNAGWDTRYDGAAAGQPYVGPGTYDLTLVGRDARGATTAPVTRSVVVRRPADPAAVGAVPLVPDAGYVAVTPQRIVDTRNTFQSLGAGQRVDVSVLGRAGVPSSGVTAVVLNVTMVGSTTDGHLRVWPAGSPRPNASAVNTTGGRTQASLVTVGVGGQGRVSLYNAAGTSHYLVDVLGYYTTNLTASSRYTPASAPVRAADTRSGAMLGDGRSTMTVDVAAALGVPAAQVSAAVVNVTTTRSRGNGHVVAYGSGTRPPTSTVNLIPGTDVANRAVVPVVDGRITLAHEGAPTHVAVDVNGWYGPAGAATGATFTPTQPTRFLDTRSATPFGPAETRTLAVTGRDGVPATATAVVGTLTAVDQTSYVTHARIWPAGLPLTATSDLNSGAGRTQANTVVVRPGTGRAVHLYNDLGRSDLVLDVVGYFR